MSDLKKNSRNKKCQLPQELFESGVSKNKRLTPEEAHALADKLLKEGFERIRKKYSIK